MPNVPISGLPLTTSVCATALVPIVQNGVTCSTYACLLGSGGGGGGGVTQITAGSGVTISPSCGVGNVTICASGGGGGVTQICGGSGISISPSCGTGVVTICSTGGGGGVMAAGSGTCSIVGSGCGNSACGSYSFSGGGVNNNSSANSSFVGGGSGNLAFANCSFVGGGNNNQANGNFSFVGGGCGNISCYPYSFIGGGQGNTVFGCNNSIVGGICNTISGYGGAILGGCSNNVGACHGVALGGLYNYASAYSLVFGYQNAVCTTYSAIMSGCQNFVAGGGFNFIGTGSGNYIQSGVLSSIVGGAENKMRGFSNYSFIGGGVCHILCNPNNTQFTSSISGGYCNSICSDNAFIGGGRFNVVTCGVNYGSILGGRSNTISANYAGAFGLSVTNVTDCSFMSNQLIACNLFGAGAVCANANGIIVPVVSDARLKTNICSLDCGINRVSLLNPVTYNWIDEKYGKGQQIGFIAQEVEKVVPEAVFKTSNDDYGFNDRPLVALLTKTIQEQELRITKLENLVQELLNK